MVNGLDGVVHGIGDWRGDSVCGTVQINNGGETMNVQEILDKHLKWLKGEEGGECANLSYADLHDANLRDADLRGADLSRANLRDADLSRANLRGADLRDADLSYADLRDANLSSAEGLLDAVNFLEANFERTDKGYIVYKTFGQHYNPNPSWEIKSQSVIEEVANPDRGTDCASGINVAPLQWVKDNSGSHSEIWKCLIEWPWLAGVVVPFSTDGKIRCSRLRLLEIVNEE